MAVDDLWMKKGPNGKKVPSARHGRGKRYRVRYTDPGGKPKEKLFAKKVDAEAFDVNVRADIHRGVYVDVAAGKTTVRAYAAEWRKTRLHRDSTAEQVERAFAVHIDPILGGRALASVRSTMVQAWVKDRTDVLAPSTLKVVYGYLSAMFTSAMLDKVIGSSPCQKIKLPDVEHEPHHIPSPEQVHALAEALPEYAGAQVYPAAGCGLRQGEIWGLEVEHLDFTAGTIRVVQQLVITNGTKPYLAAPKTKTSKRTVDMGKVVAEKLKAHLELNPPVEVEVEDRTDPRRPVTRKALLVFLNSRGAPWRRGPWAKHWDEAATAVGLPDGFGMHGLRHYYATALIAGGATVKTVQLALGHSKPTITLDTYAGFWPEDAGRTRSIMDATLGRKPRRLSLVA